MKIQQIVPAAPGWKVGFKTEDGARIVYWPVVAWALMMRESYNETQTVRAVAAAPIGCVVADAKAELVQNG